MTPPVTGILALRAAMTGSVILPEDEGYHDVRRVWNGEIDRCPAVIARCESPADVVAAISLARDQDLELSVRGGGHNVWGSSVGDDGMMVHLGGMNQVSVDPAAKRVRVGGGALLADMDTATQAHGLATTAGMVSHTGVGGLTLGGGFGWLAHRHGLAIDNLISAEVVTAGGQLLRASDHEMPDLFWALRGGGGNFGVVTEFEFQLHEVGPMVDFGMFFFGLDHASDALRLGREVAAAASRDVTVMISALSAPPAQFVPEQYHFQPGYAVLVAGFGQDGEHARIATHIRESLPPLFEFLSPMPYLGLQQFIDAANAWGLRCYEKGLYLDELSDEAIAVIAERVPGKNAPLSYAVIVPMDGAYQDLGEDDTAWGGSRAGYMVFMVALATTPELQDADRDWARSFWQALQPHARGIGCYVNGITQFEQDRVRASYGPAKYGRLARIKARYDPENVFHRNANITPASG